MNRLLLLLLLCIGQPLFAQRKPIEIDTLTGLPSEHLPFDSPFELKIPVSSDRIHSLSYAKVKSSRADKPLRLGKIFTLTPPLVKTPVPVAGKKYVIAQFRNPFLLKAGKQYTLFWAEEVSDKVMLFFDTYDAYQQAKGSSLEGVKKQAAESLYNQLVAENKEKVGVEWGFTTIKGADFDANIKKYYKDEDLKNKYIIYKKALNDFETLFPRPTSIQASLKNNASLTMLQKYIANPSPTLDSSVRRQYITDPRKAITQLNQLILISPKTYQNLLKGLIDINCNACDTTASGMVEKRVANLKTTLAAVETLYTIAVAYRVSGQSGLTGAEQVLDSLKGEIQNLSDEFTKKKKVVSNRKAIRDAIFSIGLSEPRRIGADSYIPTFETRTNLSITPDFGLTTTRLWQDRKEPWDDKANPYPFTPYLGFQINLRPINRDVTFWSYRKSPLHFLSLMGGWSLVNINNGPNLSAGADSVQSYFGGGKGTLVTGIGIRLGNFVRLTGGTMWYFQYFQNSQFPKIYDRRELKYWPFVGVSLDLSITDLIKGISEVLGQTPRRPAAVKLPETVAN